MRYCSKCLTLKMRSRILFLMMKEYAAVVGQVNSMM